MLNKEIEKLLKENLNLDEEIFTEEIMEKNCSFC